MEESGIILRRLLVTLSVEKPCNRGRRVGKHTTGTATPIARRVSEDTEAFEAKIVCLGKTEKSRV